MKSKRFIKKLLEEFIVVIDESLHDYDGRVITVDMYNVMLDELTTVLREHRYPLEEVAVNPNEQII